MNDVSAISTDIRVPRIEPRPPVSANHPKAVPRLVSSVESATRDRIAGVTIASPVPFDALKIAIC